MSLSIWHNNIRLSIGFRDPCHYGFWGGGVTDIYVKTEDLAEGCNEKILTEERGNNILRHILKG